MKNPIRNLPGSENDLRASNAILRLKLELEYGMLLHSIPELPPAVENQWLQNIYEFEKQYVTAGKISVYNFVGKPAFTAFELLTPDELPMAITEMIDHLRANGICLYFQGDYDDTLIYRFIINEFFLHEIDNVVLDGGAHCFTYEEFHPNHDHDLRRFSTNFIKGVIGKKWNDVETYVLGDTVSFHDKPHTRGEISSIIILLQELYTDLELEQFIIQNVFLDPENKKGVVRGDLVYSATLPPDGPRRIEGPFIIHFEVGPLDWDIVQFEIPGL